MRIYLVWLAVFAFSCQSRPAATNPPGNSEPASINQENSTNRERPSSAEILSRAVLKCGGENFSLTVVYENERKNIIVAGDGATIKTIALPGPLSLNGFALNRVGETPEGFAFSIEYGSRYYYEKRFGFICRQGRFYLDEIVINSFDKHDPETSWKESRKPVKPALPLENFVVDDYIGDETGERKKQAV